MEISLYQSVPHTDILMLIGSRFSNALPKAQSAVLGLQFLEVLSIARLNSTAAAISRPGSYIKRTNFVL